MNRHFGYGIPRVPEVARGLALSAMDAASLPVRDLYLVVGYDGSPPASRALDAAANLLHGRAGRIEVVYVATCPASTCCRQAPWPKWKSPSTKSRRICARRPASSYARRRWGFERRQGLIADELIAAAAGIHDAHPGDSVVIVVGSSSHAMHRVVGSAAVSLVRHSPVPVVVVP